MAKFKKFSLFFYTGFIALLWTIFQNHDEFSSRELFIFFLYVIAIIAVQAIIIFTLDSLKKIPAFIPKFAAGIFSGFNVYTLILINSSTFVKFPLWAVVVSILVLGAAFWALFNIRNPKANAFLNRFSLILIALIGVQFYVGTIKIDSFRSLPSHFTFPTFVKRPNVYVITFDAMSPEIAVKNNLGVDTLYTDKVKKFGGRVIPNAFVERISTKWSLNSFLSMDLHYFESLKKQNGLVTDKVANPVYKIFRKNDYKIQFLYVSNFFGNNGGGLDFYGVAEVQGLCTQIEEPYALMGYCLEPVQSGIKSLARIENHEYPQYLFDRIKETSKSGESWYTQAHIYMPGHTPKSFDPLKESDWKAFRKRYAERSAQAAVYLEELLNTIKEYDPNSILIVFGDHGPLVSRGLLDDPGVAHYALASEKKFIASKSPLTWKQLVQDRHGVYLAVFPGHFCREGFNKTPYSTVRIMRDVVKCLSNREDPLPADFQPNDDQWKPYMYE